MTSLRTTDITVLPATYKLVVKRWNSIDSGLVAHFTTEVTYWRTAEDAIAWRKAYANGTDVVGTVLDIVC
jgi:hypothetical protein